MDKPKEFSWGAKIHTDLTYMDKHHWNLCVSPTSAIINQMIRLDWSILFYFLPVLYDYPLQNNHKIL